MAPDDRRTIDIREFCLSTLRMLGIEADESTPDVVSITVPPERIELFEGRSSLRLAFDPAHIGEDVDLVAPGSYALDRIIGAVRARGNTAVAQLKPALHLSPTPHITLANAESRLESAETAYRTVLLACFKVSLVSDEDREQFHQVAIDLQTGRPVTINADSLLSMPRETASQDSAVTEESLSAGLSSAKAEVERMAEQWADSIRGSIESRLSVEIERLNTYYTDLRDDLSSGRGIKDPKKLQAYRDKAAAACDTLNRDYASVRRLLESAVNADDLAALAERRRVGLSNELRKISRRFIRNEQYYSDLSRVEEELKAIEKLYETAASIMRTFPPDNRLAEFDRLRDEAAAKLQERWDKKESQKFDPEYLRTLDGELNAEKAQRIAELEEKARLRALITPLSAALIRYPCLDCRFHAVAGDISLPFEVSHDLVTGEVDPPDCHACGTSLTSTWLCSCGHLACPSCHRTCAACGKHICAACAGASCHTCGGTLCAECVLTCADCGRIVCAEHSTRCRTCGKLICRGGPESCAVVCSICGGESCRQHAESCPTCLKPVCRDEMRTCSACGKRACRLDIQDCPSCEKSICESDSETCSLCGQRVCAGCMTPTGYCATCADLFPARTSVPAIQQILSDLADIPADTHKRWYIAESRSQFILVRAALPTYIYVIDKSPSRLHSQRRLDIVASIREYVRLSRAR